MTRKLYFEDAWLRHFTAKVTGTRQDERGHWLRLNQSAFYPEGGGQPGDSGKITSGGHEWQVTDTQGDPDGGVWHLLAAGGAEPPGPGAAVEGFIDWERRFDHMQQHSGEHLIASRLYQLTGGFTHGLHIGREFSTIDVTMPDKSVKLEEQTMEQIERMANRLIAQDGAIVCRFPEEGELAALPLRKDPTVTEHVRVCFIGDYELVACGGTHLGRTGQIGLVKLLKSEPARGKLRLSFLCGQRAVYHYAKVYKAVSRASALLSAGEEELPRRLEETLRQLEDTRRELGALRRQNSLARLPGLLKDAQTLKNGRRLITAQLEEHDLPALEAMAGRLVEESGLIVLLCVVKEGRWNLLFARSQDVDADMNAFIKSTGARGGGRPDFARGAAQDSLPWEAARVMAPHL